MGATRDRAPGLTALDGFLEPLSSSHRRAAHRAYAADKTWTVEAFY